MENKKDTISIAPPKKILKFTPKIPHRKLPKQEATKIEASETKVDIIDNQLLSKINSAESHGSFGKRILKNDKKVAPTQVAFGYGDSSKARSFGIPRSSIGDEHEEGSYVPATEVEKEYEEPWDYNNSYYPVTLPLRRPYSGDPEILDEQEFGESWDYNNSHHPVTLPLWRLYSGDPEILDEQLPQHEAIINADEAIINLPQHEAIINAAAELGLMEEKVEPEMLFFQFPANLPLLKRPVEAAASKVKETKKGSRLVDLPAGFMGKMLVYKSGAVKMKLGDVLYDVSPGVDCKFAQDVAVINTRERHCCILGEVKKRAVVTPDVDSLLASLDDMDV